MRPSIAVQIALGPLTERSEAVDSCRYFAGLLVGALNGVDKDTLLSVPVLTCRRTVGGESTVAEDSRNSRRFIQGQTAARHQRGWVRCIHPGGCALGVPPYG